MITIDNYEAFAIDYIEGKLSLAEIAEMEQLLAQHPALRAEFAALAQNWSALVLEADEAVVFSDTSKLLKPLAAEKTPIVVSIAAATRSLAAKYIRIAAVSVGILFGIGALYTFLPNGTSTNFAQNDTAKQNAENEDKATTKNGSESKNKATNDTKNAIENKKIEDGINEKSTIEPSVVTKNNTEFAQKNNSKNSSKNKESQQIFAAKSKENKVFLNKNNDKNESSLLQKTENGIIENINTANNKANANNAVANNTPQRTAIETIESLPTVNVQDFYFETNEDYTQIPLFGRYEPVYLAQATQNLKKHRPALNALLPEAARETAQDGSLWKAFLPEGAKENNTNLASIADAFRPSR